MKNTDKKLVIILIFLIIVLIAIVSTFLAITGAMRGKDYGNRNNVIDEKFESKDRVEGKYEVGVINTDYEILENDDIMLIDRVIDSFLLEFNSKNISTLYDRMSLEYKKIRFRTQEDLEKYLKDNFKSEKYTCFSYRLKGNKLYLKVGEVADNTKEIMIKDYVDEKNWQLYFENIEYIQQANSYMEEKGVVATLKNIVTYEDKISADILLKNNSNTDRNIEINKVNLILIAGGSGFSMTSTKQQNIKLIPHEEKRIEVYYSKENSYEPSLIQINMKIDGEAFNVNATIVYPEYDDYDG